MKAVLWCAWLVCLVLLRVPDVPAAQSMLRVHVVPIVNQGRFLETLLARFAEKEGITFEVHAQHGRKAVAAVHDGTTDLIITHADFQGVAQLVQKGRLTAGQVVFANPIALLAPLTDPAGVGTARSPEEALSRIAAAKICLVPNTLEHLQQFHPAEYPAGCPDAADGTGFAAVLVAVSRGSYAWWGLHPFLMTEQPLKPVILPDPRVLRPLMAWAVAGPQALLAQRAIEALRSAGDQQRVAAFRFPKFPEQQAWWPYAALDRLAALRARGRLVVAVKNAGARAADEHRDPAHVAKREFELRLAAALAARLVGDPAKVELRMMRKPARLPAVAGGAVDLGIAMLRPTGKSRMYADFSRPYFEDGLAVMHRAEQPLDSAASLSGRRILSLARDAMGQDDERAQLATVMGAPFQTIPVANFREAAASIEAGDADGLVSQAANIDAFIARHGSALVRSPIIAGSEYAVAIPKDNPALRDIVDQEIERLQRNGELDKWKREAGLPMSMTHGARR